MRSAFFALILVLVSAEPAHAGAWLRAKGTGFASSSVQITESDGSSVSLYFEYGLRDDITLGVDIHYDSDLMRYLSGATLAELDIETRDDVPTGIGVIFLRFPLSQADAKDKWAFHVGLGARYFEAEVLKAAEIGLSWGRSIQIGERFGWVNVDTSLNEAEEPGRTRIKVDSTIGLGLTDQTKVMLQMFNTFVEDEDFTKIAPSFLYSPKDKNVTYQIGSEIPVDGSPASLKLGIWYEF